MPLQTELSISLLKQAEDEPESVENGGKLKVLKVMGFIRIQLD